MKNKLSDLNNYLFEQIERINDDDLSSEELEREIKKSNAIINVSKQIIDAGRLSLAAAKFIDERNDYDLELPLLIGSVKDE